MIQTYIINVLLNTTLSINIVVENYVCQSDMFLPRHCTHLRKMSDKSQLSPLKHCNVHNWSWKV